MEGIGNLRQRRIACIDRPHEFAKLGCLGLDGMWQLTGFFLGWLGEEGRGMALSTGEVKFKGMVRPDTKLLEYGIDFKRVMRGRLVLGTADGWLKADGETIYQATDLRVGLSKDKAA